MTRSIESLNDSGWFVGGVQGQPFSSVNDFARVEGWLPARVPGDVRLDLLNAGKIPDPFLGYNNEANRWVDDLDWWYRRDVEVDSETGERVWLVFEGIDYQSAVCWDGVELGRHIGMFSCQVYEVPPALLAGRKHQVTVRVWGANQLPRLKLSRGERLWKTVAGAIFPHAEHAPEFPDRYATLKPAMGFGWDFAPRLRTCGIWDDAWLVKARDVFIQDVRVRGVPDGRAQITLDLDSPRTRTVQVRAVIGPKNFEGEPQVFNAPLSLHGHGRYSLCVELREPQLWNAWDRGAPNLYSLRAYLSDEQGELDSTETTFGLRAIELLPNPRARYDDPPWTFSINGVSEFIRGANWVPADAIPARVTREDYRALLNVARDAHINLLRVWGGGLCEKRAFYQMCDELGILVWQEFPFSGAGIDYFPHNPEYLALVKQECRAIVRALRNHPAVVLWCGGNEFSPRLNRELVNTVRQVVALEDGTRPFKPASPSHGESHNWRVWHGKANTRDYRNDDALFFGEFGMQAPPGVETLARFLSDDEVYPPGAMWEYHNAQLGKLWRYARPLLADLQSVMLNHQSPISNLEQFVATSQLAQARGLQIAIEHARRNKPRVSGCAFWQFNEPWYSICWSVLDYARRPKRALAKIRELYNPVLVSFDYPLARRAAGEVVQGTVWLINDTLAELSGRVRAWHNAVQVLDVPSTVQPDSSRALDSLELALDKGDNVLRFEFSAGDLLSTNEYDLNYCDVGEIEPLAAALASAAARLRQAT